MLSSSIESLRHQLEDALRGGGAPCALISWAPLHHFSSSFSLQIQLVQFRSPQEEGEASGVAGTPPYLQTNSSLCFQSAEAFLIDVAELFMGYKLADGHCLFVTVYHALFFFFSSMWDVHCLEIFGQIHQFPATCSDHLSKVGVGLGGLCGKFSLSHGVFCALGEIMACSKCSFCRVKAEIGTGD